MLSKERMEANKKEFLSLINSITRDFDKEKLVNWLEKESDFFEAPACAKHHSSYAGGLCEHSLNVYYSLKNLAESYLPQLTTEDGSSKIKYSEDTLKIVGLLHDISRANYYRIGVRNFKDKDGTWKQTTTYDVREDRLIYGSDEQNTEFLVSSFIPLTLEEKAALLHKVGGTFYGSIQSNVPLIFETYELAALLYCADLLSCYILEK